MALENTLMEYPWVEHCIGKVSYRNRYVQTAAMRQERADGKSASPGVMGPFDYNISEFGIRDSG